MSKELFQAIHDNDQAKVERLIAAAAPHVKPLLLFLIGTGARMSEALELEWNAVDLVGARAIFWRTIMA